MMVLLLVLTIIGCVCVIADIDHDVDRHKPLNANAYAYDEYRTSVSVLDGSRHQPSSSSTLTLTSTCGINLPGKCYPCKPDKTCVLLKAINHTTDVSACCQQCASTPACTLWTLNTHTEVCHLKKQNINASSTNQGPCSSGTSKTPSPPPPPPSPPSPSPPPSPPSPSPSTPTPLPPGVIAKNVLYIVVDDLRNEIGFTNNRVGLVTPNLDAFAKHGMVFDRAYVQQGVCSPSRNSFLSGRRPDTTKIWNFIDSFRGTLGNNVSSWPGSFKNLGWVSLGMGKVYHPGHPLNDDGALSWSLDQFPYFHPQHFETKISNASDNTFQDGMILKTALQRLHELKNRTTTANQPFFMAVGFHKPHVPWVMPQRFLDMQVPVDTIDTATYDVPPTGYCNVSLYRCAAEGAPMPERPLNISDQQKARRLYRAAVTWTDYNVGLLLTELKTLGFANNTAIIFHGDHGWNLGEHGVWCKQSNFDLVARVPLIVYVPWLPQSHGVRTNALVEIVDLMPTTLALMNATSHIHDFESLEGFSFLQLLEQPTTSATLWKNATFTQYPRCNGSDTSGKGGDGDLLPWGYPTNDPCTGIFNTNFEAMGHSIRTFDWRYTLWTKWDNVNLVPLWDEVVGEELYSHANDTGFDTDKYENENVVLSNNSNIAAVRLRLHSALRQGWKHALPALHFRN